MAYYADEPREPITVDLDADIESVGPLFCERCSNTERRLTFNTYVELHHHRREPHQSSSKAVSIPPQATIEISEIKEEYYGFDGEYTQTFVFQAATDEMLEDWVQKEVNRSSNTTSYEVSRVTHMLKPMDGDRDG